MTPKATEELIGTVAGERTRRDDWVLLMLRDGSTISGIAEPGSVRAGAAYRFFGRWREHPRFGRGFEFVGHVEHREPGRAGVVEYLTRNCQGVGKALAGRVWDAYGEEAVERLRTDPEAVAAEIRTFPLHVALAAAETLKAKAATESAQIELIELFSGRGMPRSLVATLLEVYGPSAPRRVRDNPYALMQFRGVGFTRADQLYLDLGHSVGRLKRQSLCAWHALESDNEGHTWFPRAKIEEGLREKIGPRLADPARAIDLAVRAGVLATRRDHEGTAWYAPADRARAEQTVRDRLVALSMAPENHWPRGIAGVSEHQADGVYRATLGPVGLLTGSPGTGKTYTLAALIRAVLEQHPDAKGIDAIQRERDEDRDRYGITATPRRYRPIYVCAPTGKAAVRATEALAKNGLDELKARTIHSTLGVCPEGDGFSFLHTAANPLEPGFLIVDEVSMLDTALAASLFSACPVGMHVLLVGDPHQLAPVGHGAPLRDMIAAGLPTGTLTEIQRNAGDIVRVCAALKDGRHFRPPAKLNLPEGNLVHREVADPKAAVAELLAEIRRLKADPTIDVARDVQILVSLNGKSPVSRTELNKVLQPVLSPFGSPPEGMRFNDGDKIICLKNSTFGIAADAPDWDEEEDKDREAKAWVANGEIGFVESAQKSWVIATFEQPARRVVIPTRGEAAGDIDLAYAITTHKSQGSEWPIAIVMIDGSSGGRWIGSRELIYTAISRAKRWCLTIGERHAVDMQTLKIAIRIRKTFLAEGIREAVEAATEGI